MKIAVLLKQVPDTQDIKWSKENNIVREGLLSILNPVDDFALEVVRGLKMSHSAHTTAFSMGPLQACSVLEYALARGADEAILLNDKKFVGSDTLATARVLHAAIKERLGDFDLILCGQSAIDGETAQTPPSLAQMLGVNYVSNVSCVLDLRNGATVVVQKTPEALVELEVKLPAVISVIEGEFELEKPKISDYVSAQLKGVEVLGAGDIGIDPELCGICGSPTCVSKVYRPEITRKCEEVTKDGAKFILEALEYGD